MESDEQNYSSDSEQEQDEERVSYNFFSFGILKCVAIKFIKNL